MSFASDVRDAYQTVLQRQPTAGELDAALNSAQDGPALVALVESLVSSPEVLEFVSPVLRMYQSIYGRIADPGGLTYWVNVFRDPDVQAQDDPATTTVDEALLVLARAFADTSTEEFVDRFGADPSPSDYVAALYRNVLSREPDAAGQTYWTNVYNTLLNDLTGGAAQTEEDKREVRAILLEQFVSSEESESRAQPAIENFLTQSALGMGTAFDTLWEYTPSDDSTVDLSSSTEDEDITLLDGVGRSVTTGSGNDMVWLGSGNHMVDTGDGDDTVITGPGDDTVSIGDGDDTAQTGAGDDLIIAGAGGGIDVIDGGLGSDTVSYPSAENPVLIDLRTADRSAQAAGATTIGAKLTDDGYDPTTPVGYAEGLDIETDILISIENADGGAGNDTIIGNDGNNTLQSMGGDDDLQGFAGNDALQGGTGNDLVSGGSGNDDVDGGRGDDNVSGGEGNDTATYVAGQNVGATDFYDGNQGTDTLTLELTQDEADDALIQADIAAFEAFLTANANPASNGATPVFQFTQFGLLARNFEAVNIDIIGVGNTAPTAANDAFSGDEDLQIAGNVLDDNGSGTDSDADGDPLHVVPDIITTANGGLVTLLADGSFIYDPALNFNGSDGFQYTLEDGFGGSDTGTVSITINPVQDDPIAADDAFGGAEGAQITGNVLSDNGAGADDDPDGDALNVVPASFTTANGATVNLLADGSFTYDPATNQNGPDSFDYTLQDGNGGSDIGTVNISVSPVQDDPIAADDAFSGDEDTQVTGNVLTDNGSGADSDPDGDPLTVAPGVIATANGGTVNLLADGSFTYDPAANFNGLDQFDYTLLDGNGGTDTGTVTITVNPVPDDPFAANDTFIADEEASLVGNLLSDNGAGADSDPDGDPLSVAPAVLATAGGGTVNIFANGFFIYDPAADFFGPDQFSYTLLDGNGGTDTGTVSITVDGTPDFPVAADDTFVGDEDTQIVGNVLDDNGAGADSDPDGDPLSVTPAVIATANGGTVNLLADGSFTYDPAAHYHGPDSFEYTLSDGSAATDIGTVSITINPVQDEPVAADDAFTGDEDTQIVGNVLNDNGSGADSDADGDPLTVVPAIINTANGGTVNLLADGSFTYDPAANYNGPDTFDYTLQDGNGGTDTGTVSLTINPVQDDPVAADDNASGDENTQIVGNVLANNGLGFDSDPDGDPLSVVPDVFVTANGGTVTILANGSFTYDPAANYNGPDSFDYTLQDGNGGSDTGTVNITVNSVPSDPIAADDAVSGDEDTQITGNVLDDNGASVDSDPDGDALSVTPASFTTANGGTVNILADGSFTYDPAADYNGPDSFDYTLLDGNGGSDTGTVNITVNPIQDDPVAADDDFTGDEDTQFTGNVLSDNGSGADSDPDGDVLSVVPGVIATANGGTVNLLVDGSFTYDPATNYNGPDSFTYTLQDGNGGSDTGTVNFTVNPVPDGPPLFTTNSDVVDFNTIVPADYLTGTQYAALDGNDTVTLASNAANAAAAGYVIGTAFDAGDGDDNVTGGALNDVIFGGDDQDTLNGGDGDDALDGQGGNDILLGGDGSNTILGATGNDSITVSNKTVPFTDTIDGGSGADDLTITYGAFTGVQDFVTRSYSGGTNAGGIFSFDDGAGGIINFQNVEDLTVGGINYQLLLNRANLSLGFDALGAGNGRVAGVFYSSATNEAVLFDNGLVTNIHVASMRLTFGGNTADPLAITGSSIRDLIVGDSNSSGTVGLGALTINAGDGNDEIDISNSAASDSVDAGAGDDLVFVDLTQVAGDALLDGGAGSNDTLAFGIRGFGTAGTFDLSTLNAQNFENLIGSGGDDTLIGDGLANDLRGGAGNDLVQGGDGNDTLFGDIGSGLSNSASYGHWTDGNDTLEGGAGDDTLIGGGGDDLLDGGTGTDMMTGDAGIDVFVLRLGDGAPTLANADIITDFEDGADLLGLTGGLVFADLTISQGIGANAADTIIQDTASGEFLAVLQGTTATDVDVFDFTILTNTGLNLPGTPGNDILLGSEANDTAAGDDGSDIVLTRGGNDSITVSNKTVPFTDTIDGGSGADDLTITYGAFTGVQDFVTRSYSGGTNAGGIFSFDDGAGGIINFQNVEDLTVGGINYQLLLNRANLSLGFDALGAGNGRVAGVFYSSATNEAVLFDNGLVTNIHVASMRLTFGGNTADPLAITGSSIRDLIVGDSNSSGTVGLGALTINAGDGNDEIDISNSAASDSVDAGAGDDLVFVDLTQVAGDALLDGGAGSNDTLAFGIRGFGTAGTFDLSTLNAQNFENLIGSGGDDTLIGDGLANDLRGGAGNDLVQGGDGNDTLFGDIGSGLSNSASYGHWTDGNDTLEGGAGDDTLIGGGGDDLLDGGTGTDMMTGDAGIDVFVLRLGDGAPTLANADIITDFEDGADLLGLTGGLVFADLTISQGIGANAADTIIQDTASGEFLAVLQGTTATDVDVFDFTILTNTGLNLPGTPGNDILLGSEANDTAAGDDGSDIVLTRGGNDSITVSNKTVPFTDTIDGGSGADDLTITYGAFTGVQDFVTRSYSGGTNAGGIFSFDDGAGGIINFQNVEDLTVGGINYQLLLNRANLSLGFDALGAGNGRVAGVFYSSATNEAVLFDNGLVTNIHVASMRLTFGGNTADPLAITGSSIRDLIVGDSNSSGTVGLGALTINAGDGNDEIDISNSAASDSVDAGAGDDLVFVDLTQVAGDALLDGGAGSNDTLAFGIRGFGTAGTFDLSTLNAQNFENLIGSGGDDTLIGDGLANDLRGGAGNDLVQGGDGNDTLFGDIGSGLSNSASYGHWTDGNDTLEGGAGDDTLIGGGGDDLLDGGTGTDMMTGDAGADVFVLRLGDGAPTLADADIITDFENGSDLISLLGGLLYTDLTVFQGAGANAADTIIQHTTSSEFLAILQGTTATDIDAFDFL